MREYKFRAWIYNEITEQNEMCYDLAFEEYAPINDLLASVKNLMQDTGLEDKNGKEIYGGDIVKIIQFPGEEKNRCVYVGAVRMGEYCHDLLRWGGVSTYGWHTHGHIEYDLWDIVTNHKDWCEVEIIGNIYENPELLEVEE